MSWYTRLFFKSMIKASDVPILISSCCRNEANLRLGLTCLSQDIVIKCWIIGFHREPSSSKRNDLPHDFDTLLFVSIPNPKTDVTMIKKNRISIVGSARQEPMKYINTRMTNKTEAIPCMIKNKFFIFIPPILKISLLPSS